MSEISFSGNVESNDCRRQRINAFLTSEQREQYAALANKQNSGKTLQELKERVGHLRAQDQLERQEIVTKKMQMISKKQPEEDDYDRKLSYSSSLDQQVQAKAELVNRQKADDFLQDRYAQKLNMQHNRDEQNEILKKNQAKEKYFQELKEQVEANAERKKKALQAEKDIPSDPEGGFSWSRERSSEEKHKSQQIMKESLDKMIADKKEFVDYEKQELKKFETEMEKIKHENDLSDLAFATDKKNQKMASQKEYMDYLDNQKKGTRYQEEVTQQIANEEFTVRQEHSEEVRVALKDAQHKLEEDTQDSWGRDVVGHQNAKEQRRLETQEEAAEMSRYMKAMDLEDEKQKQKTKDINKQYQQDLLDQMKWKK